MVESEFIFVHIYLICIQVEILSRQKSLVFRKEFCRRNINLGAID